MRPFEVEKDGKIYLVIEAFHYLREGIGASDLLAVDYSEDMKLRLLTASECTFHGFRDDVNSELIVKYKGIKKEIIEKTSIAD